MQQLLGSQKYFEQVHNRQFRLAKYQLSLSDKLKRRQKRRRREALGTLGTRISLEIKQFAQGNQVSYKSVLPLHRLWTLYMDDLVREEDSHENKCFKILKADFHGAMVRVLHCRDKPQEGLQGIVVKETLKTLEVVEEDDRQTKLMKENCVLLVPAKGEWYRVVGAQLVVRPGDRPKYKFRAKERARKLLASATAQ